MFPAVDCVPSLSPEGCAKESGIDLPHPSHSAPWGSLPAPAPRWVTSAVADVTRDPPALPGCSRRS